MLLLASAAFAAPARAVVSPSGVNWASRHVLALQSDDIGNGEFTWSVNAATRWPLTGDWTGEQWTRVADAMRGREDALGVQVPLTLYVVAAFMEPDFTPVTSSSSLVFNETFSGTLSQWSTFGSQPPTITSAYSVSPTVSAAFSTSSVAADGYARRWIVEAKEYEFSFWYRLETMHARTHLVSLLGPMGRAVGLEAQAMTGMLYLREAYYNDEFLTPVGPCVTGVWRRVTVRVSGGRTLVDLNADGVVELDKVTRFLPAFANAVYLGDPSTSIYSGSGTIDDLLVTRYENTYPDAPRITPIDQKFPDVVEAIQANRDIFAVLSHGLTHGNDAEVQRRYANGIIVDRGAAEENWWREDYDAVNDRSWGVLPQFGRLSQAFDILERAFGERPVVHVSPGNVYGADTDAALALCGCPYHETMTSGGGMASLYEPGVFWSVRTTERELFYRAVDPNPLLSATGAARSVDSLFTLGYPAILQTHAFNAQVTQGNGDALAFFYRALLDSVFAKHPETVALGMEEVSALERDGWSVSMRRENRIYARNYLPAPHTFHVPIADSLTVLGVRRLPAGQAVSYNASGGEVVFTVGEGDYVIELAGPEATGVASELSAAPASPGIALLAAPNPSRGSVALSAGLPVSGPASVDIYDLAGRRVHGATRDVASPGPVRFDWDGTADGGGRAAPGIYLARLRWTGGSAQAKILLVP